MLKKLLFLLAIFTVFVRAQVPDEDELDVLELENFANAFKTEIIDKERLTCANYNEYCNEKGVEDFGNDPKSCKIWTGNYLCKKATDIESLKKTLQEINSQLPKNTS